MFKILVAEDDGGDVARPDDAKPKFHGTSSLCAGRGRCRAPVIPSIVPRAPPLWQCKKPTSKMRPKHPRPPGLTPPGGGPIMGLAQISGLKIV